MLPFHTVYLYARTIHSEDIVYIKTLLQKILVDGIVVLCHIDFLSAVSSYPDISNTLSKLPSFTFDALPTKEKQVIMAMGGDGTILHVVHLLKGKTIPVLGINLGRLGFLSGVKKIEIAHAINALFAHNYYIDKRTLIGIASQTGSFGDFPYGLNEFSVRRLDSSPMINISIYLDDELLNSYWADGMLISTPTGSTAYSLSCGGPILFPQSGNFVITPVAPHSLSVRPVVIKDDKCIRVEVAGRSKNFMITLDARHSYITSDQVVQLKRAPFYAYLVYVGSSTFMNRIREKLHWGEDKRN